MEGISDSRAQGALEGPVRTLADLAALLETRPKVVVIQATPDSREIFKELGKLAGFTGVYLSRFVCSGAICIARSIVGVWMNSMRKEARMKHLRIIWTIRSRMNVYYEVRLCIRYMEECLRLLQVAISKGDKEMADLFTELGEKYMKAAEGIKRDSTLRRSEDRESGIAGGALCPE